MVKPAFFPPTPPRPYPARPGSTAAKYERPTCNSCGAPWEIRCSYCGTPAAVDCDANGDLHWLDVTRIDDPRPRRQFAEPMAILHPGEAIIPSAQVDRMREQWANATPGRPAFIRPDPPPSRIFSEGVGPLALAAILLPAFGLLAWCVVLLLRAIR